MPKNPRRSAAAKQVWARRTTAEKAEIAKKRRKPRVEIQRATPFGYELAAKEKEKLSGSPFGWGDPANIEIYDPRPQSRVDETGSWVMITRRLPPIEGRIDEHVRVGRIFFIERNPGAAPDGFLINGTYKAVLNSPWGTVHLWPYEYSTIDIAAALEMWTSGEILFRPLHIDGARFSEIAFYARSRGIGVAAAAVMALGTLQGAVGWFEPREDLAADCEDMERRVHTSWPVRFSQAGRRRVSEGA